MMAWGSRGRRSNFREKAPIVKDIDDWQYPVKIIFTHWRVRLCDTDGLSGKYWLDALVSCGLLKDDSLKFVSNVTHYQKKVYHFADQKLRIEIIESEPDG